MHMSTPMRRTRLDHVCARLPAETSSIYEGSGFVAFCANVQSAEAAALEGVSRRGRLTPASHDPFSISLRSLGAKERLEGPCTAASGSKKQHHRSLAALRTSSFRVAQSLQHAEPFYCNGSTCCNRPAAPRGADAPRGAQYAPRGASDDERLAPVTKRRARHRPSAPAKRPQVRAAAAEGRGRRRRRRHGHGGL